MIRALMRSTLAAAVLTLALGGLAQAEKAKDTLRIAFDQPVRLIDAIHNPNPESNLVDRAVMDTLIAYDVANKTYKGQIAESWKQVDETTLDVKIRQGVKFSDGTPLDADDVLYSLAYVTNPNVNFLFKDARFGWFDKAEKLDQYTVRIHSKEPTAIILARLWGGPPILPSKIHSQLADKTEFGRKPIGTGPYKVVSFDLPAVAKGEGGKICRGLTPLESAVLLELPLPQVLAMVITDLLNKGAIRTTSLKPLTVEALGKRAAPNVIEAADGTRVTVEPYEVGFLDVLVAPPAEVEGKDFTDPLDKLVGLVKLKVVGFDVAATRAYYKDVTARAWDRVSNEQDPAKKDAMANQWMSWMTMDPKYDDRMQEQTRAGWFYNPFWSWWPRTGYSHSWFHDLNSSVSGVAQRSAQALGGPNIKLDLSGVDRFTLNTLGDLAKGLASGSGGCAGGGCACAGCACACACAGGGR